MAAANELPMNSSYSSLMTDNYCPCHQIDEVTSTLNSKQNYRHLQRDTPPSNVAIFVVSLHQHELCRSRKIISVDVPLLCYAFLVRLINRAFNLHSNFTVQTKGHFVITDDFDLDGCLMSQTDDQQLEFVVDQCDVEDWCIVEEGSNDNFDIFEIDAQRLLVTAKPICHRQESLLRKATNWLHGSFHPSVSACLTKSEFFQMLDPANGRLLNEEAFRRRVYETGCEQSIRKIAWCYLFQVFNQRMTNEDKIQYTVKARERYYEMKQAWRSKQETEITALEILIQKDVTRTDSSVKFFDNKRNLSQAQLLDILMTYCIYHPEPGYAQGMTDMAAPILYVVRDEALAYACFCALMRYMSPLFHSDGVAVDRRLNLLRKAIRAIDTDLWARIERCDISNLMFAYRWLLLDCKREFPFKDIFRVFETVWAAMPIDRFELNTNCYSDLDDLCPSSICSHRHSSATSSITNTILSSHSCASLPDEVHSERSSVDGGDSGYRDEQVAALCDLHAPYAPQLTSTVAPCAPLESWLTHFAQIDDSADYVDMFVIFLCVALLEQNRSSIMQVSAINRDNDDYIGFYFTRLVRQNDAKQALRLARHYHKQYVIFQARLSQLLAANN